MSAENSFKAPVVTARAACCAPRSVARSFAAVLPAPYFALTTAPLSPTPLRIATAGSYLPSLAAHFVHRVHRKSEISEQPALRAGDLALGSRPPDAHRSAPPPHRSVILSTVLSDPYLRVNHPRLRGRLLAVFGETRTALRTLLVGDRHPEVTCRTVRSLAGRVANDRSRRPGPIPRARNRFRPADPFAAPPFRLAVHGRA